MTAIKLIGFTGEQPRIIPRLMAPTAAQSAVNTRLDDGALTPMRKSADVAEAFSDTALTIYKHGEVWLDWDQVVNAAPGPVAQDRLYYTGDGVPKMRVGSDVYDLAVPAPPGALTATLGGSGSGDVSTRVYCFTHVTSFGEESEPSPASNAVDWQPGNDVTLSGFPPPPSGRGVTLQRIYRSQTGQSGTYFFLIAERSAAGADFVDTVAVDAFQEALPSAGWTAPPDDLAGLTNLQNGMMAAFVGRDLYFCEPYRPHAWPEKYVLTTDWPIVGLGAMGTAVIVLTTGQPYIVSGTTPESMQMQKVEANFPCINARGIVDLGYAIAYPSNEGIVIAKADGSVALATAPVFNRDDWLALSPATLVAGQLTGRYVAFYDTLSPEGIARRGTLFLDLSGQSFLIRSDAEATAVFYDVATGSLHYLARATASIRQLDAPNAARADQYWRSKAFITPAPTNFGAILIDADETLTGQEEANLEADAAATIAANEVLIAAGSIGGDINAGFFNEYALAGDSLAPIPDSTSRLAVGVYADGRLVASVSRTNRVLRLPAGFTARKWEVDVFGNVRVERVAVASTVDELKGLSD